MPLQLGSELAAAAGQCKNPRKDDEGQSDSVGITAPTQEHSHAHATNVVTATADVHKAASALKANRVQVLDGSPSGLDGKAEDITMMGLKGAKDCSVNPPIGPNGVKPKSTWTRFNRMDFGLGGLQKVLLPSNGKRPIPVEIDRNQNIKGEEGRTKRGKFENGATFIIEGSAGVDDHPCREQ